MSPLIQIKTSPPLTILLDSLEVVITAQTKEGIGEPFDKIPLELLEKITNDFQEKIKTTQRVCLLENSSILINENLKIWEKTFKEEGEDPPPNGYQLWIFYGYGIHKDTKERRLLPSLARKKSESSTLLNTYSHNWEVKKILTTQEAKSLTRELQEFLEPSPTFVYRPKSNNKMFQDPEEIQETKPEEILIIREFLLKNTPKTKYKTLHPLSPLLFLQHEENNYGKAYFFHVTGENGEIIAVCCYYTDNKSNRTTRSLLACRQDIWNSPLRNKLTKTVEDSAKNRGILEMRRPIPKIKRK